MFAQVLYVQWKWARTELLAYAMLAFLAPVLMLKIAMANTDDSSVGLFLGVVTGTGVFFVFLAFACAVGFSVRPWLADQALKHVYALSLPVPWSAFVRYRFLAGALLLTVPTVCVWAGGVLAVASSTLPPTLHAYPGGIAVRFLCSALVFYAATFLLQYAAGRNAARVVLLSLLALLLVESFGRVLGLGSAFEYTWNLFTSWPGPFETLSARWMLIDV